MKNVAVLFIFMLFFSSCRKITKDAISKNLSGYWEIEKVILKDGSLKNYEVSTTIDFIEITSNKKGYRKKLQPDLTGKFYGSDDLEQFQIMETDNGFWLHYETNLMTWKEKIIEINRKKLVLQNENDIIYHYKRYEQIEVN